jgi:hypothetical protein
MSQSVLRNLRTSMASPPASSSSNSYSLLSAIGTIVGYIGTEVATSDYFHRLLWPQRAYNNFSTRNVLKLAFFMPLGGPLHRAALQSLDEFFKHGLFKGEEQGHMLGTAFFPDLRTSYKAHTIGQLNYQKEWVRNCLWVRALMEMPAMVSSQQKRPQQEDGIPLIRKVRQRTTVSHLTLFAPDGKQNMDYVDHDVGPVTWRTIVALITTEATGIAVAVMVAVIWKSPFMVLWLMPLILKLLSAFAAIPREDLIIPGGSPKSAEAGEANATFTKFEISNSGHGFQVIDGHDALVLQFFRHYGHPIRSRQREIAQMGIVIAFGLVFPVGLLCSLICMPIGLQYVWVAYELYATLAMYVYRYSGDHRWATTEERIAQTFANAERKHRDCQLIFRNGTKNEIGARLVRTAHNSYAEGKAHLDQILSGEPVPRLPSPSGSSDSSGSEDSSRQPLKTNWGSH